MWKFLKELGNLAVCSSKVVYKVVRKSVRQEIELSNELARMRQSERNRVRNDCKNGVSLQEAMKILNVDRLDKELIDRHFDHLFLVNEKSQGGTFYLQSKAVRAKERIYLELEKDASPEDKDTELNAKLYNPACKKSDCTIPLHRFFCTDTLFYWYVVIFVLYLLCGAMIFSILETPAEEALLRSVVSARMAFFAKYPSVTDEDLENLIIEIVRASNRGVSATRNCTNQPNWSFGQSLFFSSTVVTTIGYGHVTPLSRSGKIFCIAYATCGIPLTLVLMSALVERLMKPAVWLLQTLNSKLGHLYQPFNVRLLHLFIIVTIVVLFFMILPAAVFAVIEPEWDFLDSFYYCFISLTTIGLGDYIPGDNPEQQYRPVYKILTTCYLLIGLTFMMLALAVFYDIPQLNIGVLFKSHNIECDSEKARLSSFGYGLHYGISSNSEATENTHMHVVRVRSRQRDDSPSPDEPLTKTELDQ